MPKFLVRQRRPYWVCLIQEIEADTAEDAEDKFYSEFDPQHRIIESAISYVDEGPAAAFDAAEFDSPLGVAEAD